MSDLKSLLNELSEIRRKFRSDGRRLLAEEAQVIFNKHQNLKAIQWVQYIPGFNDGDPCTFTQGENTFVIEGFPCNDTDYNEYEEHNIRVGNLADRRWVCPWDLSKYLPGKSSDFEISQELYDDLREFARNLGALDDVLAQMFGNDARVILTPDEIFVEEYECGY